MPFQENSLKDLENEHAENVSTDAANLIEPSVVSLCDGDNTDAVGRSVYISSSATQRDSGNAFTDCDCIVDADVVENEIGDIGIGRWRRSWSRVP